LKYKRLSIRTQIELRLLAKRIFDIVTSFFGLVLLSPVLLVISLLIRLYMSSPVFFCQERTGRYGKPFTIYKFRTMFVNHGGNTVSIRGESRITPLGAILRKYKLDELPELWNVFKGDMSFVGPRPDMPEYTNRLIGEEKQILKLRPGITGPATLRFANEEEILAGVPDPQRHNDNVIWPEKVRLNLEYLQNRSFIGDILIIIKTLLRSHS
jgi:lipopolysaccharide/colanic/teichoic acid biosynthesis glycosyltransferase